MKLTERLQVIADLVKNTDGILADVGTDHGHLPIYFAQRQTRPIYAMDIRKGPLERARENARFFQVESQITFLLSDGLEACRSEKISTLIIAGMGGMMMEAILRSARDCFTDRTEMILSPHADIHLIRRCLPDIGFQIEKERILKENGKFYTVIYALVGREKYNDAECYLGKFSKSEPKNLLLDLRAQELNEKRRIYRALQASSEDNPEAKKKKQLLKELLHQWEFQLQQEKERGEL